jgi:hypothetical protein
LDGLRILAGLPSPGSLCNTILSKCSQLPEFVQGGPAGGCGNDCWRNPSRTSLPFSVIVTRTMRLSTLLRARATLRNCSRRYPAAGSYQEPQQSVADISARAACSSCSFENTQDVVRGPGYPSAAGVCSIHLRGALQSEPAMW